MGRPPMTGDELDRIRELHAEGKSCRAIAADLGRAYSSVSRHARDMGLKFDTERTEQATEVRTVVNRAKRADLESRFLDEAAKLLDQLHQPAMIYNWSKENHFATETLDEPDVHAKAALIRAAGVAVDKAVKLADSDKATTEADAGKSMVGALFMALRATPVDDLEDGEAE